MSLRRRFFSCFFLCLPVFSLLICNPIKYIVFCSYLNKFSFTQCLYDITASVKFSCCYSAEQILITCLSLFQSPASTMSKFDNSQVLKTLNSKNAVLVTSAPYSQFINQDPIGLWANGELIITGPPVAQPMVSTVQTP